MLVLHKHRHFRILPAFIEKMFLPTTLIQPATTLTRHFVPPSPIQWARGNFVGRFPGVAARANAGLISVAPSAQASRRIRVNSRNSCQKNFAPLRPGVFALNSTLHPVRNFEQSHNRFGKTTGDNRVHVM